MFIICTLSLAEIKDKNRRIEELISEMSCGRISAMGELYELIKADVYAYALSKTGHRENAEDIMQDTFVQIYKYAAQYRPQGKPMAWIVTIELNLIRRRQQLSARTVSLDDSIASGQEEEDFAQSVINNEFLRTVMRALSEDEREVITLHINSGLKHREIAEILEKPLSTVLSRYNRAIRKLQAIVKEKT